ncbi:MAG TPA: hypothetical protein VIK14_11610 [Ignavibacteria bacterium]
MLEIRTLIENRKDTQNLFTLLKQIEKDKDCKLSGEKEKLKESWDVYRFICQNITHKSNNVTIPTIGYNKIKLLIDNVKEIYRNVISKYYDEESIFEVRDIYSLESIINDFNNLLLSYNKNEK